MVWRITVLTDPPPPIEDLDDDPPPEDELPPARIVFGAGVMSETPTPDQWPDLLEPSTHRDDSDTDGAAPPVEVRLQLAAMVRETMGPLDPADDDMEAMVARAAQWDD